MLNAGWNKRPGVKYFLTLITLILAFYLLLGYKITDVPPGINNDEASIGYNAALVAKDGKDENGRFLPLFILTLDKSDWKQPVTFYATVAAFKIFGPSYKILRLVSVIFVLISAIFLFILVKEALNINLAIISSVFFIFTPIIFIQSHLALENIAVVPFVLLWLLMLNYFQKTSKNIYLLVAGLSLGVGIYSYNGMRIIVPILALLSMMFLYLVHKKNMKESLLLFLLGFIPFVILLIAIKNYYPGAIFGNSRPVNITSYQDFFYPYLSAFDLTFLFIKGDSTPYHSTGRHGIYLLSTLPFFILGIFETVKSRKPILLLSLAAFFLTPLLFGLVGSVHRGSRLLAQVPLFILITTSGVHSALIFAHRLKRLVLVITMSLFIFNVFDFLNDYWIEYKVRAREHFPSSAHLGYRNLYEQSRILELTPIVQIGVKTKEGIAAKFFNEVYFANDLSEWEFDQKVPSSAVVLSHTSDIDILIKGGYKKLNIVMPYYTLSYKKDE